MPNEQSSLLPAAEKGGKLRSLRAMIVESPVVKNTGSTARDHLANERTYLAWMRTSLALIGASLALLKWELVSDSLGYIVATVGIVALGTATDRYFTNMRHLERGEFAPNVRGILIVVVVTVFAIVGAFIVYFSHSHNQ